MPKPKSKPNYDMLLELATHLERPAKHHLHKFDFTCINAGGNETRKGVEHCGSYGCAMGETPLLWPKKIRFDPESLALFRFPRNPHKYMYDEAAARIFNTPQRTALDLFSPGEEELTGIYLEGWARPKEVARRIRKWVAAHKELHGHA